MKEKIFDQKIEEAANRFEDWIEASADTFERELTRTWNEHFLFRFVTKGITIAIELGLIISCITISIIRTAPLSISTVQTTGETAAPVMKRTTFVPIRWNRLSFWN